MTRAAQFAGVVLAAGAGRRMGGPKADIRIGGERLVDRAASLLDAAGCTQVFAVVRPGTVPETATAVVNHHSNHGMRSSLALGIAAVADDVDAIAVLLVDTPGLTGPGVRNVLAAWRPDRIALALDGDRRGHPTVMSPAMWREAIMSAAPDEGARAFLAARPHLIDEVPVPDSAADLDTPQDLRAWLARTSESTLRAM